MSMSIPQLAQVLFTSALQPSDRPSAVQVRIAIDERLSVCGQAACAAYVAQEAGDHPEAYAIRMRWALNTVASAYPTRQPLLVAA
jgi:hypothetical protein